MTITKILRPDEFTAETLAEVGYTATAGPTDPNWSSLDEATRKASIDQMQFALDGLVAQGVLG